MNEQDFQNKLAELITQIDDLPEGERERIGKLADETRARHDKMKAAITGLQESLDYLRLSVKYLVFDLEATRRENEYLKGLLENRPLDSDHSSDPGHEPGHDHDPEADDQP